MSRYQSKTNLCPNIELFVFVKRSHCDIRLFRDNKKGVCFSVTCYRPNAWIEFKKILHIGFGRKNTVEFVNGQNCLVRWYLESTRHTNCKPKPPK